MSFAPLWEAGPLITSHALAAIGALVLGALQLLAPKGTLNHRVAGYVWVALMLWIALSSFGIHKLQLVGPFSPIHLLSIFAIVSIIPAIRAARKKNIAAHRKAMISLYFYALVVAGLFTFLPDRVMNRVLFGG